MTRQPLADADARHRIRTEHGTTLFVEAGAGTGKTTALIERIVDMVSYGFLTDIAHLAAITFTENAAAELRSRLRAALDAAGRGRHREHEYDVEQSRRARAALARFDDAAVTTLHGFAARILAEAPLEAGLPPGFAVRDAISAQVEQAAAWRRFLDELLDDRAVAAHISAGLTLDLKLDQLKEVAAAFAGSWDLLVDRPLQPVPLPRIDAAPIVAALRRATAEPGRWPQDDGLTAHLRGTVLPVLGALEDAETDDDVLAALMDVGLRTNLGKVPTWRAVGLDKGAVVAHLAEADSARAALLAAVGHAVTTTLAARVQDHVLGEARSRRDVGRLDFHDLLVFARDLLRDREALTHLRERWQVVMIDEFQDTDPLQVEIVDLLAGDRPRFFVGDPKQSIYRFRRADVTLYGQVREKHPHGRVHLDVNFRSVPGILEAVNLVFRDLMRPGGSITYADLLEKRPASDGPAVTVLGGPSAGDDAEALREREAEHVVDVLARAHGTWEIGDKEHGRKPRFADMAILVPTRISLPAIEAALQDRDIPYRVESRSLIWSTDAVRDVVTILTSIDNPADAVATAAALRHPGLACSDVDLAAWVNAGGSWNYLASPPSGVDAEHPVAAGMATLRRYHDLRWWLPVHDLVALVVRELRLVELTAELRRPRDHWRRLRFLVDQARAFSDAGGSGLGAFVEWAVTQEESDIDVLETAVPEPDDDAVRILTIHGAKGLEFPVTAVVGLGGTGRVDAKVLWTEGRPRVRFRAGKLATDGWDDAAAHEKTASDEEALRLLYVAMTRAQDHLVLGCYHKPTGQPTHAHRLVRLLAEASGIVRVEPSIPEARAPASVWTAAGAGAAGVRISPEKFDAARPGLLADVRKRTATTPTELVALGTAAGVEPEIEVEPAATEDADEAAAVPGEIVAPAWRRRVRRGHGAQIGTAVHRVLELVEPTDSGEDLRRLAEFACDESGIPSLVDDVIARVGTALASPLVGQALRDGRAWREVYLVVPDGERVVEGYVDLLTDDGTERTVVDYKTDRATTDEQRAAKEAYYAPQLAEYARMVEAVTGRKVRAGLVFASGEHCALGAEGESDEECAARS